MLAKLKRPLNMTEGERGIVLAYLGLAIFGAGLAFTVVNRLGGAQELLRPLGWVDLWMILAGALGADAGLFLGADKLGHAGWRGVKRALAGCLIISLSASVVAGTLALPGFGTMFGPFATAITFWQSPIVLVFWLMMLLACHLLFANWRRERETLFTIPDDGLPV